MSSSVEYDSYRRLLREQIHKSINQGNLSFDKIQDSVSGFFPTHLMEELRCMRFDQILSYDLCDQIIKTAELKHRTHDSRVCNMRYSFPLPHPVDFDWRFSIEAIERLTNLIRGEGQRVICMGCPSIFKYLSDVGYKGEVILIDRNADRHSEYAVSGRNFTTINEDVGLGKTESGKEATADVIYADPPWYVDDISIFFKVAGRMLKQSGRVYFAAPPVGTRPSWGAEWSHIVESIERMGMRVECMGKGCLPYEMPLYEKNVLYQSGVRNVSRFWRKADLFMLHLVQPVKSMPMTLFGQAKQSAPSIRLSLDGIEIVTITGGDFINRNLGHFTLINGHGFLSSVSSKDVQRGSANIITSGGRFIKTSRPLYMNYYMSSRYKMNDKRCQAHKSFAIKVDEIIDAEIEEVRSYYGTCQ